MKSKPVQLKGKHFALHGAGLRILRAMKARPVMYYDELSRRARVPLRVLYVYCMRLEQAGLLQREKDGRLARVRRVESYAFKGKPHSLRAYTSGARAWERRERGNKKRLTGMLGIFYIWKPWDKGDGVYLYVTAQIQRKRKSFYVGTQNTATAYRFGDALMRAIEWRGEHAQA